MTLKIGRVKKNKLSLKFQQVAIIQSGNYIFSMKENSIKMRNAGWVEVP